MTGLLRKVRDAFQLPAVSVRIVVISVLIVFLMIVALLLGATLLQMLFFVSAFSSTLLIALYATSTRSKIAPEQVDFTESIPEFRLLRNGRLKPNKAALELLSGSSQTYWESDIGWDQISYVQGRLLPFRLIRPDPSDMSRVLMLPSKVLPEENTLHGMFEQVPIALLMMDMEGQVELANSLARDYMRLSLEETPSFAQIVENSQEDIDLWLNQVQSGERQISDKIFDASRGDAETHLQFTARVVHLGSGPRILAVIHDATEMKSLEAQFVQSQKMQAIGQLAGGVAHDFNNLLTAISGYCDLLLLRHEQGDPDFADLMQIEQNANRAAALVGQLLAFSRKQTMQSRPFDIEDAFADLAHLLNRLLGERVQLSIETIGAVHAINADKRQLEQVIMNLVVNARDAMPDGGQVIVRSENAHLMHDTRIERAMLRAGDYLKISVCDSGTGIPKGLRSKIFEPFYTTKNVGEGTGLGLSTVYGIIKQMGGFIFVHDAIDFGLSGACFEIYLPALSGETVIESVVQTRVEAPLEDKEIAVLLVEDEAPVRAFATKAMTMRGFVVTEAATGEDALQILEDEDARFDVMISDVVMPGMDGPTWVRQALIKRPGSKVIFVSGYAEESFEQEHLEIPDAVFLAKPFSLKDLISTVQRVAN